MVLYVLVVLQLNVKSVECTKYDLEQFDDIDDLAKF